MNNPHVTANLYLNDNSNKSNLVHIKGSNEIKTQNISKDIKNNNKLNSVNSKINNHLNDNKIVFSEFKINELYDNVLSLANKSDLIETFIKPC